VLLAALVAGGCTIPGSSRLEGPPKDLPPSLHYVSADVLGFSLYDTDPTSKLWAAMGDVTGGPDSLPATRAEVTLNGMLLLSDNESWIGDTAGVATRELQLEREDPGKPPVTLWFADVRSRSKLERALRADEWKEQDWELADDELTAWSSGGYPVAAVADDAIIIAQSRKELERWVRMAQEYAVADRKALREYAVEARKRSPASFVFRGDLWRTQVRRPFEDVPALLEFARWFTDSNTLVALRDGWFGIAPPLDRKQEDRVRLVGASEWVPDLAPDVELKPVSRDVLRRLPSNLDLAIALHDPGQQLRELVRAITVGAGQYVTGEDVANDKDRVELLPVLDELDGDAAIGFNRDQSLLEAFVEGDADETDVRKVLRHAGVPAAVHEADGGVHLEVSAASKSVVRAPASVDVVASGEFDAAGKPPRPPVLWVWSNDAACLGRAAGWVTFDGIDELRMSMSVNSGIAAATPCPLPVVQALSDLGLPLADIGIPARAHS
jgi:hypothetical protein